MAMKTYSMGILIQMDADLWPNSKKSHEDHAFELAGTVVTLHQQRLKDQLAYELLADLKWGTGHPPKSYMCQNHIRMKMETDKGLTSFPCLECHGTHITPIPFGELTGDGHVL